MEIRRAAPLLTPRGHPGRLAAFRLPVRFAPRGVRRTETAGALGVRADTLSLSLDWLMAAGLGRVERRGRSVLHSMDLDAAEDLLGHPALGVGRAHPDPIVPSLSPSRLPAPCKTPASTCSSSARATPPARSSPRRCCATSGRDGAAPFSAGTRPDGALNPLSLEVLRRNGHDVSGLRPKHVSEFQRPGTPVMHFVFTVCDTAAAEECPPWPGRPITGHWGLPDPVKAQGTDAERVLAFAQTYAALRRRIEAFVALPLSTLDRMALQARVDRIGLADDVARRE